MATNNTKDGWEIETVTRKIPNTIVKYQKRHGLLFNT